jgi:antitoxin component of MazEF toxin-antitoxin module
MLELKVRKIGNSLGVVLPRRLSTVCAQGTVTGFF